MKTNHNRQFKAKPSKRAAPWAEARIEPLSGKSFAAGVIYVRYDGHRGEADAKRGAKKYLNSRIRFHQKAAVQKMVSQLPEEKDGDA